MEIIQQILIVLASVMGIYFLLIAMLAENPIKYMLWAILMSQIVIINKL